MVLPLCQKIFAIVLALGLLLFSGSAQADSNPKTWAERLGLISYEPYEYFHPNFESLAATHLDVGPLERFVPESAQRINVYSSRFLDQVIADYEFDKRDWDFFRDEWEELVDQSDIDYVFSVFKTCPWKRPLPKKGRYFISVKEKRWDISGYVMIDEDHLQAWYYWSVAEPTRGTFCQL